METDRLEIVNTKTESEREREREREISFSYDPLVQACIPYEIYARLASFCSFLAS